jgi:hypothetical protein
LAKLVVIGATAKRVGSSMEPMRSGENRWGYRAAPIAFDRAVATFAVAGLVIVAP